MFLVGESKFFDSKPKTSCKRHELRVLSCKSEQSLEVKRTSANESYCKVKPIKAYDEWETLPAEELTKLAARMNRQSKLYLEGDGYYKEKCCSTNYN
ncbi:hypothetical protein Tco_1009008 [Tanacetum coccineum]